jgi:uncharacterized protein YkwD
MPRAWGRLVALVVCTVAASSAAATADAATGAATLLAPRGACGPAADQVGLDEARAERAMLCLTNYARRRSGLRPLALRSPLEQVAQSKLAADVSCNEFSHTPCNASFTKSFAPYLGDAAAYDIGENIAWSTGGFATPRETMTAWLDSPDHRANILNPAFRDLGVGYLPNQSFQGSNGATLWSQDFGVRR